MNASTVRKKKPYIPLSSKVTAYCSQNDIQRKNFLNRHYVCDNYKRTILVPVKSRTNCCSLYIRQNRRSTYQTKINPKRPHYYINRTYPKRNVINQPQYKYTRQWESNPNPGQILLKSEIHSITSNGLVRINLIVEALGECLLEVLSLGLRDDIYLVDLVKVEPKLHSIQLSRGCENILAKPIAIYNQNIIFDYVLYLPNYLLQTLNIFALYNDNKKICSVLKITGLPMLSKPVEYRTSLIMRPELFGQTINFGAIQIKNWEQVGTNNIYQSFEIEGHVQAVYYQLENGQDIMAPINPLRTHHKFQCFVGWEFNVETKIVKSIVIIPKTMIDANARNTANTSRVAIINGWSTLSKTPRVLKTLMLDDNNLNEVRILFRTYPLNKEITFLLNNPKDNQILTSQTSTPQEQLSTLTMNLSINDLPEIIELQVKSTQDNVQILIEDCVIVSIT